MKRLILGALALVAALILVNSLPDLVRYVKISRM
jgi:hypothetical protein